MYQTSKSYTYTSYAGLIIVYGPRFYIINPCHKNHLCEKTQNLYGIVWQLRIFFKVETKLRFIISGFSH
jgi:hypothetical protein